MKKYLSLLAALVLPMKAHAFLPIQYVQISTTSTPTIQHGIVNIDSMTVSSVTVSNQIMFVGGSSQTVSGQFGRLVQAVISTTTASTTSSGTGYTVTTTTATINMINAGDWVKIQVSGELGNSSLSTTGAYAALFKNGSNTLMNNAGQCVVAGSAAGVFRVPCSIIYWDRPGTTAGTAYTVYIRSDAAGDATWTNDNGTTVITVEEYTNPNKQ